ncbi:hypothetical protein MMC06_006608 [Schaereria dolodes]|nr:hypothetical protein [Schaereria dolodes]
MPNHGGLCDTMYYKTQYTLARTHLNDLRRTGAKLKEKYNEWHAKLHEAKRGLNKLEYGPPPPNPPLKGRDGYMKEIDEATNNMESTRQQMKVNLRNQKKYETYLDPSDLHEDTEEESTELEGDSTDDTTSGDYEGQAEIESE